MPPPLDLTGQRFGKLTVVRLGLSAQYNGRAQNLWVARCECGDERAYSQDRLMRPDASPHAIRHCPKCRTRACIECGTEFTVIHGPERYCSDQCKNIAQTRKTDAFNKTRPNKYRTIGISVTHAEYAKILAMAEAENLQISTLIKKRLGLPQAKQPRSNGSFS